MNFIKLTNAETGVAFRLNVSTIHSYCELDGKTYVSFLDTIHDDAVGVKETVEEIDSKIYAATGQKVGGGH